MEDHLQQQVAEFAAQVVQIAAVDRVGDFVGFLHVTHNIAMHGHTP
jgi:hypothetical protein